MRASQRIANITGGGDDGWSLFYKARAMIAAGAPVLELTIGEHDIRTDPRILDEMHLAAKAGHTGYASVPGMECLREAVAQRVSRQTGVATTKANVLITAGGQAGLFAAHHATCDEGARALFIDPYYATYPGVIRGVGALPVPVIARPEDGFQPKAAALEAVAPRASSLLINSPNNPTGAVYSQATLDMIADIATKQDLWVISDEVYDTQIWSGRPLSIRALPRMAERVLVVGSLSKSHAMTGSRIGWVVGPEEMIAHMTNLATHITYGVAGYIQEAGLYALSLGAEFEAEIAAPFRRRRDLALARLEGQSAIRATPPEGAMYLMLDIRATGLSGEAFGHALLEAEKIAVMPGESFGQAAAGHIRVALTLPDAPFEDAFGRLVDFAKALAK